MNTSGSKAVPQIKPDGTLSVCAWCWPGETVFEEYPWLVVLQQGEPELGELYPGQKRPISHNICERHRAEMLLEVLAAKLVQGVSL